MSFTRGGRLLECDLRPLLRLIPRLRRSVALPCQEQVVHLRLEPLGAVLFVLVAREWNKGRNIEGHIIEIQGVGDTTLISAADGEDAFENNHVFFVRARLPERDIQKRFRRVLGSNERRQTTEEERDSLPMKELKVESERDLNLNQLLNRLKEEEDGRSGRRRPDNRRLLLGLRCARAA